MAHSFLAVESNPANNAGDDVVLLNARSRSHHRAARTALVGLAHWFNRLIVWHALIIVAALLRQKDFLHGLFYHSWFLFEIIVLAASAITFGLMEARTRPIAS